MGSMPEKMNYVVWISGRRGVHGFYSQKRQAPLTLDARETVTIYTLDGPVSLPVLHISPFLKGLSALPYSMLTEHPRPVVEALLVNSAGEIGEQFLLNPHRVSGIMDTFYSGTLQVDGVKEEPDGFLKLQPLFSGRITLVHLLSDEVKVRSEGWE